MSTQLEIAGLTRRYGATTAVDRITHRFAPGRITAVVGPSGSGKSTTLSMIAGLLEPDAGIIRLDGTDITAVPAHARGFGMVFQHYALFPHLTALGNVEFGLRVRGCRSVERRRRALEALERTQIAHLADRRIQQLSGGEQQRVALARAIVFEPRVLLLDEPFAALDAKLRETLRVDLRRLLHELAITAIHVTHDQIEAYCLAEELVVMKSGRIEQAGPPLEVYAKPATPFVATFLGSANLLDGEVVITHQRSRLRLPFVEMDAPADLPAGSCRAMIRPEDIVVSPSGNGDIRAEVVSATFLGNQVRLGLRAGGCRIDAMASNDTMPAVGDTVEIRILAPKLRILPHVKEAS
jgi:putative spermidine/putrescine transport system ATP-binding protein